MCEKIVFICPDERLTIDARQIIEELDERIEIYQGSRSEGVKIAKSVIKNGANIIISRGGTGSLIKRNLQIPVVNVEISSFDIINSINKAITFSNCIGIVGFEDLVHAYERVGDIIQKTFSTEIFTALIKTEREAEIRVKQLNLLGARVFIGGQMVIAAANKFGYPAILIESGKDAIIDAIKQAKHLLEVRLKEKEEAEIMKSIIDFTYDGIFSVDKNGFITVFNPAAEKILGISAEGVIGKLVDDVVENTRMKQVLKTGEGEFGEIQHVGKVSIVTNRVPIVVDGEVIGAVATFQELEKIQKVESQIRKKLYSKGHVAKVFFHNIIGKSKAIEQTKEKARQFAGVDSTVLIQGETGTGKELFAQSIHNASRRADKPFVAVNCAALPENLLESELFGYVEGAFTGARKGGKAGLFELAHEGTIFLDEIGEMASRLQSRFLRVLQEKEVVRIGDERIIPVDIRVIAATNKNLYKQVEKGDFREDLYYRLNVLRLEIPPLRNRLDDIPALAKFLIEGKSKNLGMKVKSISQSAVSKLVLYHWPGNVRQFENIIERSVVLCKGEEISLDVIIEAMNGVYSFGQENENNNNFEVAASEGVLKQIQGEMIKKVLEDTHGNKTLAAERLGISVTTLWRKLKNLADSDAI